MDLFRDIANNIAQRDTVVAPEMRSYFQNQMVQLNQHMGYIDSNYISSVNRAIEVYNSNDNIYNTQVVVGNAEQYIGGDAIYCVTEDNCAGINFTMRRYVMAHPEMRTMYNEDVINGYDGMFIDVSEYEDDPYWNEDYLTVMDGVSQIDEEGNEYAIHYDSDVELNSLEQGNILDSWDNMLSMVARGIDPTLIEEE